MATSQTLTAPSAGEDGEERELLVIAVTLEDSLPISYKSKHTPYCIPKVTENLYPQKILTQFKK